MQLLKDCFVCYIKASLSTIGPKFEVEGHVSVCAQRCAFGCKYTT